MGSIWDLKLYRVHCTCNCRLHWQYLEIMFICTFFLVLILAIFFIFQEWDHVSVFLCFDLILIHTINYYSRLQMYLCLQIVDTNSPPIISSSEYYTRVLIRHSQQLAEFCDLTVRIIETFRFDYKYDYEYEFWARELVVIIMLVQIQILDSKTAKRLFIVSAFSSNFSKNNTDL